MTSYFCVCQSHQAVAVDCSNIKNEKTRKEASWLEGKMSLDGHKVGILSGDLDVTQREIVIRSFRDVHFRVLITTNVCSRGLDIPQVNLVINWNMPTIRSGAADCETYLHRIGRSGRFGKEGLAINFLTSDELHLIAQLESHFEINIPELTSLDLRDFDNEGRVIDF